MSVIHNNHSSDKHSTVIHRSPTFVPHYGLLPNQKKPQKDLTIPKFHRRVMVFDTETSGLMPKHRAGTPFPPMEEYPYIMQFSWVVYNVSTNTVEEVVDEYIKIPNTVIISPESINVHGITREIANEKGKPIVPMLDKFFDAYMKCDCIVAHNLQFDGELVRKEMWRNRVELNRKIAIPDRVNMMCGVFSKKFNAAYNIDTFCTMMNTIEFCGIEFAPKPAVIIEINEPANTSSSPLPKGDELSLISKQTSKINKPPTTNTRKKFPRLNELYCKLFEDALPENLHNSIVDVLVCLRCFLKIRVVKDISANEFGEWISKYN